MAQVFQSIREASRWAFIADGYGDYFEWKMALFIDAYPDGDDVG